MCVYKVCIFLRIYEIMECAREYPFSNSRIMVQITVSCCVLFLKKWFFFPFSTDLNSRTHVQIQILNCLTYNCANFEKFIFGFSFKCTEIYPIFPTWPGWSRSVKPFKSYVISKGKKCIKSFSFLCVWCELHCLFGLFWVLSHLFVNSKKKIEQNISSNGVFKSWFPCNVGENQYEFCLYVLREAKEFSRFLQTVLLKCFNILKCRWSKIDVSSSDGNRSTIF